MENLDEIICTCLGVSGRTIKEAVDNGASTVQEIQDATGAGTICGACLDDISELVDKFVSERG